MKFATLVRARCRFVLGRPSFFETTNMCEFVCVSWNRGAESNYFLPRSLPRYQIHVAVAVRRPSRPRPAKGQGGLLT